MFRTRLLIGLILIGAATLWAYWSSLAEMANKWEHDPQYSHGYLVPLFAAALLWLRREHIQGVKLAPSWWGLPILLSGVALRMVGTYYYLEWFDFLSLIPCVAGVCLLLGGWRAMAWAWPSIGFLVFMIPLPYSLEVALQGPLQRCGTLASTYLMQTAGLPAVSEGNVIIVGDARIGVVEACSGLRMLMIFFALSAAVALLCERALWERGVILLSAIPIAIITNVLRITTTGACYALGDAELAEKIFHDWAGYLMMPVALILLWLELWVLSKLLIVDEDRPMSVGLPSALAEPQASPDRPGSRVGVPSVR